MPTSLHDTGDRWAWDAGYCEVPWPLPAARLPGGFYVNHYKEMGYMKDSAKLCAQTQHQPAPLSDYHLDVAGRNRTRRGGGKGWSYVPRHIRQKSSSSGIRATRAGGARRAEGRTSRGRKVGG